jgi:hypothetical protein
MSRLVNLRPELCSTRSLSSAIRRAVRSRCAFCRQADEQYTASARAEKQVSHIAHVVTLTSVTLQLLCWARRGLSPIHE